MQLREELGDNSMRAPGFFDLEERFAKLDELGDPLKKIAESVNWEGFRAVLTDALSKSRKSKAGRKEYDRLLMFKILVLQQLYNLSDAQTEYQVRDRYSFGRFLGLSPEDAVPDAKTVWRFREGLKLAGVLESLYVEMLSQVEPRGYIARKGQIVDASVVKAPRQRNSREDNEKVKRGEVPQEWSGSKRRHKDVEARWTRKGGVSEYGYKNHISVDREFGVIRRWEVTAASCHDSRVFEELLDERNSSGEVWGTVRISAVSMRSCFVRGVGAAGFTARRTAIGPWVRGHAKRIANARRCARRSSTYLLSMRRWEANGCAR